MNCAGRRGRDRPEELFCEHLFGFAAEDLKTQPGDDIGVHATPTFFVDGERLDGPWRQLAQIVPARLEKAKP